jgi:4-hydroxy-tetrahydrodipicolinate synthase
MAGSADAIARGAGAALITLFDPMGKILIEETAAFARLLVESGARSVLMAGSAGEFWALADEERIALVTAVIGSVPAATPVFAHVGGVPLDRAVALTRASAAAGASAVIALPLGVADLAAYYGGIKEAAGEVPVFAYHLPQAGAVVPTEDLPRLGVAGIKDSSGDAERLIQEVLDHGTQTYIGSPALLGLGHDIGAAGALLGLANVHPDWCANAFDGDRAAQGRLAEISSESTRDFPHGLKRMAAARWGISSSSRT